MPSNYLQGAQHLALCVVQQHDVVRGVKNAAEPLELAQILRHAEISGALEGVERSEAVKHLHFAKNMTPQEWMPGRSTIKAMCCCRVLHRVLVLSLLGKTY